MNIILIITSLLTVVVAQQPFLNCNYRINGGRYACDLSINNPNGLNNFTEIGGNHLDGFTNTDAFYIFRVSGTSTNVPSIICETFLNLNVFDFYNAEVTEVDDNAFGGCSNITGLSLSFNRITSISANAFVSLPEIEYIDLQYNSLTTLPENVFATQRSLTSLYLSRNAFLNIPNGLFQPLENLQNLELSYNNLTAINNQWFTSNTRLFSLYLAGNRISLSADSFVDLDSLLILNLENNAINEIPRGTFAQVPNLQILYLNSNNFTELQADSFPDLGQLTYLYLTGNPIELIHDGAFRGLGNLILLDISSCRIRELYSNSFEGLGNLFSISLSFNEIEYLTTDVFVSLPNIVYVDLRNNRVRTLWRRYFGSLINLRTLDLDRNLVNAIDREIIDDAVNLNILNLDGNFCANSHFGNFLISRAQHLPILEGCFTNARYSFETITEGNEFSFFEAPQPGVSLRFRADNEIQIALAPFNFTWRPIIEILIGTTNNTRSVIRVNQETNVVTVPTPNIINQIPLLNDIRVTWANQVVLVYSGNASFPFLAYTMQDFFPVNFFGLRTVETTATIWSLQPFQLS